VEEVFSRVEFLLRRDVEGYTQQMEYQDDQPSNYPTDRADEYREQVDGYVVGENQVRQEQENQPDDPIDDELPQITPTSRQQKQDHYHNQYEYDEFHHPPFYTTR
jgi:hypothetical protein